LDSLEDEKSGVKGNYNKLYAQFNSLQSQNDFNLRELEELRELVTQHEREKIELREQNADLSNEVGML